MLVLIRVLVACSFVIVCLGVLLLVLVVCVAMLLFVCLLCLLWPAGFGADSCVGCSSFCLYVFRCVPACFHCVCCRFAVFLFVVLAVACWCWY